MAREMFGVTRGVEDRERRRSHPTRSTAGAGASTSTPGDGQGHTITNANYGVPVRRPDGVARELYMLTGGKTPVSLVPTSALGLASKPVARRKWEMAKFNTAVNNAAIPPSPSIELKHWAPVGQPHDMYAFARFNKPVRIIKYTQEEYNNVVQHLMPLNVDEKLVPAFKKSIAQAQATSNTSGNNIIINAHPTTPTLTAAAVPQKTPRTPKAVSMQLRVASRIEKMTRCKKDTDQSNPVNSSASLATPGTTTAAAVSAAAAAATAAMPKTPIPPKLPIPAISPKTPQQKTPAAPSPSISVAMAAAGVVPTKSPKSPKNATPPAAPTTPGATNPKTWKDIMSPIMKAPSAAPPSSVAAGTRKSFTASPKALALAAEAANITLPDPSIVKNVKAPRTPRQSKPPKRYSEENVPTINANANSNTNINVITTIDVVDNDDDDMHVQKKNRRNTKKTYTKEAVYDVKLQKPWTREETDTLFQLCEQYDLRFPVVYDRWELEERSVEELKDRYYSVAKALIEHRTRTNKDALTSLPLSLQKHCQAITMNPYDYEYECIRKNQQEWQYKKSKREMKEEEAIVREAKRIEASRKRQLKERSRLAKLLTQQGNANSNAANDGPNERNAQPAQNGGFRFSHRKITCGAFARSSLIYTPITNSSKSSKRIDLGLVELGVGTRPTPTSIVVDNFDLLRLDILKCIELERTVAKKEEDVHMLRVKLAKLKGETPPAPPAGVNLSHKKRKLEEVDFGSLFGNIDKKKDENGMDGEKEKKAAVPMEEGE